ncbi:MAG: hypothetical protein HY719_09635 [Planctomycetes bacterium]|nr:hypothetical protein [Planctomycetota bacterium]
MAKGSRPANRRATKRGATPAQDTRWADVVELRFEGERFQDHALDFDVLPELIQFKRIIVETAKALWKRANPGKKKLPAGFDERIRLRFVRLKEGSAVVPVQAPARDAGNAELFGEGTTGEEAINLAWEVLAANEKDEALPTRLPKEVVPEFAKWGETLREDESIGIQPRGSAVATARGEAVRPPRRAAAKVTLATRARLATYRETPHEGTIEVQGAVLEADVRQRRFQVWRADGASVRVTFDEGQEEQVTTALKEHRSRAVRVVGRGERAPDGTPLSIHQIDALEFVSPEGPKYDDTVPPIEEVIAAIWADVTPEEWARIPTDLSENLDKHIHVTRKPGHGRGENGDYSGPS